MTGLLVAADLMVPDPKTLGADASVAEVRDLLANPKVRMVLLTDGRAFKGAVTHVPPDAPPGDRAVAYIDPRAETISPSPRPTRRSSAPPASPNRRVIVLDDAQNLLGLLCLNPSRTGFCGVPETAD